MMKCPYCQSELEEETLACRFCTKDLYLINSLLDKVSKLENEKNLAGKHEELINRIAELELLLSANQAPPKFFQTILNSLKDIGLYIGVPLFLLLAAHEILVIVYDANMIYLRLISIGLPLPFGYLLFSNTNRKVFSWFSGALILSIFAVLGMSWQTSLVDHSPILPQSIFEWKETFEYASSIALSFLTGMLIGKKIYLKKNISGKLRTNLTISIQSLHGSLKQLQEYGTTVAALITTALSIYTGLKHIVGN